jgi:hypothetical protein
MWISIAGVLNSNITMMKSIIIANVYCTGETVVVCAYGNKTMAVYVLKAKVILKLSRKDRFKVEL